jgi:ankyrin repeat protein
MKYIKLFEEHSYSVYELITMAAYEATDLLIEEIKKRTPDLDLIRDIFEYSVVDINGKKSNGWTALIYAAELGKEKAVELLLNHPGIDVNVQTEWGRTALMLAAYKGNEKVFKMLLNHPGINVNLQDNVGWTALFYAADWENEKAVELLLNHPGIDITLKNDDGFTAWDWAGISIRQEFPKLNPDFQ